MEAHDDEAGGNQRSALEAVLYGEKALRAVLEGLPDATVATGRDERIVFVNAHAETLFGYDPGELIGRPVQTLWPERVRDRYTRNMRLYFATEHPLRFTIRADGLRRDGTEFVGEMSWGIVETEAGPLLLAIGRDMTAHREAMARLRRQSQQAEAVAGLGERALSGADVGDLAVEALGQLRLAFQPIVSLADRSVVGHEALLRWDSPGGVMNAPADFIPVAEESALIVEIGAWTLMQACHESAAAFGCGVDRPAVWVNVSPRQLAQPDLPAVVADCLASSGLPAARLRLEVKERVLQEAPKTARANVAALRELGVGLALDDFGTGYSSLRDLPVRAIKIDSSFVAALRCSPGDEAIVSAIVSLSAALGIAAVAEGVESEAQAEGLAALGCPYAQGYLFGLPGPRITSAP